MTIVKNVGFHVSQKKIHIISPFALQSSRHWIEHYVISWWHSHIGECYHHQPHLSGFGFKACYFLWDYNDDCDSGKEWYLLWSIPSKHVFPSNCGGFQMSTLIGGWVFSLMCQHGVGSKGHWRSSFFSFEHIFIGKRC